MRKRSQQQVFCRLGAAVVVGSRVVGGTVDQSSLAPILGDLSFQLTNKLLAVAVTEEARALDLGAESPQGIDGVGGVLGGLCVLGFRPG